MSSNLIISAIKFLLDIPEIKLETNTGAASCESKRPRHKIPNRWCDKEKALTAQNRIRRGINQLYETIKIDYRSECGTIYGLEEII